MLPRQFPCYDLQQLRNLLPALRWLRQRSRHRYTFLIPNKTSDAVAGVTVVLPPGSDDRPTVSARRRFSGSDAEELKLKHGGRRVQERCDLG